MLLAVRISRYGCTWEVWRALMKLELLSAVPQATLALFSCSPNHPRASITRYMHAKHEPILKCKTLIIPQFHPQKVILSDYATKTVMSYRRGRSCDFQPSFRGGSLSFVPNELGGSCHVFSDHHILKCSSPPPPPPPSCTF